MEDKYVLKLDIKHFYEMPMMWRVFVCCNTMEEAEKDYKQFVKDYMGNYNINISPQRAFHRPHCLVDMKFSVMFGVANEKSLKGCPMDVVVFNGNFFSVDANLITDCVSRGKGYTLQNISDLVEMFDYYRRELPVKYPKGAFCSDMLTKRCESALKEVRGL